jgi:hypothetical protein
VFLHGVDADGQRTCDLAMASVSTTKQHPVIDRCRRMADGGTPLDPEMATFPIDRASNSCWSRQPASRLPQDHIHDLFVSFLLVTAFLNHGGFGDVGAALDDVRNADVIGQAVAAMVDVGVVERFVLASASQAFLDQFGRDRLDAEHDAHLPDAPPD